MKFKKALAALACLFAFIPYAWGADYYVDPDAAADGDGSLVTPWDDIVDVNTATLAAGDTIYFKRGSTLRGGIIVPASGAEGNPLTLDAYGTGADPIISNSTLLDGAWENTTGTIYKIALVTEPLLVYNDITVLTPSDGNFATLTAGQWDWEAGNLYINIGADPTGGQIEAAQGSALKLNNKDYIHIKNLDFRYSNDATAGVVYIYTGSDNNILYRCSVSRALKYGVRLFSNTGTVVDKCIFSDPTAAVSTSTDSAIYLSGTQTATTIKNSTFSGSWSAAIYLNGVNANFIFSNTFTNTTTGIVLQDADNNKVYSNTFACWNGLAYGAGGNGIGINVRNSSELNSIYLNTIGGYVGLTLFSSSGAGNNRIFLNQFTGYKVNGAYIGTGGTTVAADGFFNNTIIHNPVAGTPAGSIGHGIAITSADVHAQECTHAKILNNLFVGQTAGAEMISFDGNLDIYPDGMAAIEIDYNHYYQQNSGAAWRLTDTGAGDITSLSEWQTMLSTAGVAGADAHSTSGDSLTGSGFIPPKNSQIVGTGVFITGFHDTAYSSSDYAGNPVPPYDIPRGAFTWERPSGGVLLGGSWGQ